MSILVDRGTRVLVQGITGRDGSFHARSMKAYGTSVVAGVTPGKGGQSMDGIPVFNSVAEAVSATGATVSCIYVPAAHAPGAVIEAADAGLELVVCITEGIPTLDIVRVMHHLEGRATRLIGPNCPGLITPGEAKIGIMPGAITTPGPVGVVSRSGTLTYEVVWQLTEDRLGQTTCIGIGGDPIIGTTFLDTLRLFEADPATKVVVLIGEIGGDDEEQAARFVASSMTKPVVAFIAGQTAPPGRRMGHAGAIVTGSSGTAASKIAAFAAAGVAVAKTPSEIPALVRAALPSLGARRTVVARTAARVAATAGAATDAGAAAASAARPAAGQKARAPKAIAKTAAPRKPAASKRAVVKKATMAEARAKSVRVKPSAATQAAGRNAAAAKARAKGPAGKKLATKKPAAKKPAARKPVAKKPAAKKSATKKPVARKPAVKKPAASKVRAKPLAAKKPAPKRAVSGKPASTKRALKASRRHR